MAEPVLTDLFAVYSVDLTAYVRFDSSANIICTGDRGTTTIEQGEIYLDDDTFIYFGADQDVGIEYDEDGTNQLRVTGADWLVVDANFIFADSQGVSLGADSDLTMVFGGTNTLFTSNTGDFILDNVLGTGSTIMRLGTDDAATDFQVQNNSEAALFTVTGAGVITMGGPIVLGDDVQIRFGASTDGTIEYVSATDDFLFDGATVTSSLLFRLGSDTSATDYQIQNNSAAALLTVDGAGLATLGVGGRITAAPTSTTETNGWLNVGWAAVVHTGTPHGIVLDYSGLTSLSNAGDVVGITLAGETNAGGGNSVGMSIDGNFDIGVEHRSTVTVADDIQFQFGGSTDATIAYVSATDDLLFDAATATASILLRCGTDTSATDFQVQNDSAAALFTVDGAGLVTVGVGGRVTAAPTSTSETNGHYSVVWPAVVHTGTPHGIVLNYAGLTSLTSGSDVYAIDLNGETNAGGGNSVAVSVDSGFDIGAEFAAPVIVSDDIQLRFGASTDTTVEYVSGTNDFLVDAATATASILLRCGTDTNATDVQVQNDSAAALFTVDGSGLVTVGVGGRVTSAPTSTTETNAHYTVAWPAVAHTGTPYGISLNYSGLTSLNNAGDVYAVYLRGETNAGAGDSVALSVDSGFDIGAQFAASVDMGDDVAIRLGASFDATITYISATDDLLFDGVTATASIIHRMGTDTSATDFQVQNDSAQAEFTIGGDGAISLGANAANTGTIDIGNVAAAKQVNIGSSSSAGVAIEGGVGAVSATADTTIGLTSTGIMTLSGSQINAGAGMWVNCPSEADPNPNLAHRFFSDFTRTLEAEWTITEDDAACTQATGDYEFGSVLLTCDATTDDNAHQIEWANETFQLVSGKKLWYETRIRCASGDVTNMDFFVGLQEAEDITGVADNMPANGIGFHKDDDDTNIDIASNDAGTPLEQPAVDTIVNNTWVRLGFLFNGGASGSATITPYLDGVAGTAISSVTYVTMALMAPVFMIRNGDATTQQTLEVDYVKVVVER